jgi:hypothetical protein
MRDVTPGEFAAPVARRPRPSAARRGASTARRGEGGLSEMWAPDGVALDEIEIYGNLIIAASASDQPLSQREIDAILGVDG